MTLLEESQLADGGRGANARATSERRLQVFGAFLVVLSAAAIAVVPTLAPRV
jgi:hypothetical protein